MDPNLSGTQPTRLLRIYCIESIRDIMKIYDAIFDQNFAKNDTPRTPACILIDQHFQFIKKYKFKLGYNEFQ